MHCQDQFKDAHEFSTEIHRILVGASTHNRPRDAYDFSEFVFPDDFSIPENRFEKKTIFFGAAFAGNVDLHGSSFTRGANFSTAVFRGAAGLHRCLFFEEADFFGANFHGDAVFASTKFFCRPDFGSAQFHATADFRVTEFYVGTNFSDAKFAAKVNFAQAVVGRPISPDLSLPGNLKGLAIADFTSSVFEHPEDVVFLQFNRASSEGLRARFLNSNISRVRFEDVNWRRSGGRLVLEDELDVRAPSPEVITSHELVANTYRALISNFEARRHYDLAEDSFCGAMEMKRLDPDHFLFPRLLSRVYSRSAIARRVGAHLSIAYLYRVLSKYGSSYTRALTWLLILILSFAAIYPFLGLWMTDIPEKPKSAAVVQASSPSSVFRWSDSRRLGDYLRIYGAGLWTSLDSATFRKDTTVEPATKWGRRVALVEMVVVPGQLALFLLALRRRFRR